MTIYIRSPGDDELRAAMSAAEIAFGSAGIEDEDWERERKALPATRAHAAFDAGKPVALAGAYKFDLTVPGGYLPCAGVTWVGVMPTHRRRGILRDLMRQQLEDVYDWGEPIAALWASEAAIYGRFGYGQAAPNAQLKSDSARFALRQDAAGAVRLVDADEALQLFWPVYESVRATRAGMLSRDERWWKEQRLADPESRRRGASKKFYAAVEVDARIEGYAMYRVKDEWEDAFATGHVRVLEAFAASPAAEAVLWRYLHQIDLTVRVEMHHYDPGSRLPLLVRDPRALGVRLGDGLWLRLVDLDAALKARSYTPGQVARAGGDATSSVPGTRAATGSATTRAAPRTRPTSRSTPPTSPPSTWARSTSIASRPRPGRGARRGCSRRPRRSSSAPICPPTARRSSEWPGTFARPRTSRSSRPPSARSRTTSAAARTTSVPSGSRRVLPLERMHAAFDGDAIVGGAGAFPFQLTVPGGVVPCGGVTVVGVLPTHRRRGVLTAMMRAQLEDVRDRGEPIAALWASEEVIYGRFGYGMASLAGEIDLSSGYTGLRQPPDETARHPPHQPRRREVGLSRHLRPRAGRGRPGCSTARRRGGSSATWPIRPSGARAAARRTCSCSSSTASLPGTRSTASSRSSSSARPPVTPR